MRVYIPLIGCGYGIENVILGVFDSYDEAFKTIVDTLREKPADRHAWYGIETWEMNSKESVALKEFDGAKLCRELGL